VEVEVRLERGLAEREEDDQLHDGACVRMTV